MQNTVSGFGGMAAENKIKMKVHGKP